LRREARAGLSCFLRSCQGSVAAVGKGVYKARWLGFGKTGGGKPSTFFPKAWTQRVVEEAIRLAAGLAIVGNLPMLRQGSRWQFKEVVNGVRIEGLLSWSRKTIITSYPSRRQ
jgi:Bacterial EndoU nuclease